jgi:hypothetical protein
MVRQLPDPVEYRIDHLLPDCAAGARNCSPRPPSRC